MKKQIVFAIWFGINCIGVFIGLSMRSPARKFVDTCEEPIARIEYVIPGHLVGCWLGERSSADVGHHGW
jgi:hypothetical protein